MPRSARKKSSTGIYHVIFRGINKQRIFEDEEDYFFFLEKLSTYQVKSKYEIYAYCLMSNHIHLLLKEGHEDLGISFRRIGSSYVSWYNWKYNRVGHLFQDRYKSEAVETDSYLLTVLRYIHQNPINAGIVKKIQEYPWSSYREYSHKPVLCNTDFILNFFSSDPKEAKKLWVKFVHEQTEELCMDYTEGARLKDSDAIEMIKTTAKVDTPADIQSFELNKRNVVVQTMKKKGLSLRQIERLTGISFGVLRNIKD
jgi:putative transposase